MGLVQEAGCSGRLESQGSCVVMPENDTGAVAGLGRIETSAARAWMLGSGDGDWSLMRETICYAGKEVAAFVGKQSDLDTATPLHTSPTWTRRKKKKKKRKKKRKTNPR